MELALQTETPRQELGALEYMHTPTIIVMNAIKNPTTAHPQAVSETARDTILAERVVTAMGNTS